MNLIICSLLILAQALVIIVQVKNKSNFIENNSLLVLNVWLIAVVIAILSLQEYYL